ncbi:hypothetical protein HH214_00845 [Mucilaginibacter robiniae]|uniref:Uncharacterized protein n=1 Tax=Mucilaginibacter robiniae TaxID=2728022 RepID=A0A7L5DWA1_9SPHI|nr:hypothetical protein [Mucilaginibacter robiniae]QJD94518.1 hypothetical protein HH214_00845 [Mucilaginibacter robiniae]
MSKVSEIKCPHCKEWTLWRGGVDDRCLYCGGYIDPQRFSREIEKKIRAEVVEEKDIFFIKPNDGWLRRKTKQFLNAMRWYVYYFQIVFFVFVSLLLVLISLLAT